MVLFHSSGSNTHQIAHIPQPGPGPAGAPIQKKACETRFNKMDDRNRVSNWARSAPDTIGSTLNKEVMAPCLLFPNRSCWLADSSP